MNLLSNHHHPYPLLLHHCPVNTHFTELSRLTFPLLPRLITLLFTLHLPIPLPLLPLLIRDLPLNRRQHPIMQTRLHHLTLIIQPKLNTINIITNNHSLPLNNRHLTTIKCLRCMTRLSACSRES